MERTYDIIDLLKKKKKMSTDELCREFFCSPATMRRELSKLEHMGAVKRVRGGAILRGGNNFDYSAAYRMNVNIREKQYICSIAKDFLSSGMSIFIDSSSTAEQICPYLSEYQNLTVVTNGINAALILNEYENIETYITGGHLGNGSHSVLGELAGNFIENFKADLALLSCRGVSRDGTFEADHSQALIKQHMIDNAKSAVLLFDSSKTGKNYFYRLSSFDRFTAAICNLCPDDDICEEFLKSGCELLY